jgi:hypothetical protein
VISVQLDPVTEVRHDPCGDAENKKDENNDCESAHTQELPGTAGSNRTHPPIAGGF